MPPKSRPHLFIQNSILTPQEEEFFKLLFSVKCTIAVSSDALQEINTLNISNIHSTINARFYPLRQFILSNVLSGHGNTEETTPDVYLDHQHGEYPIGQFVLTHVLTTLTAMIFINDINARDEILSFRHENLLGCLKVIYKNRYSTEINPNAIEQLDKCLFLSVYFSFSEESVKKYLQDYFLVGSYRNKATLVEFKAQLTNNYRVLNEIFRTISLSTQEIDIALNKYQEFNNNLKKTYQNNTTLTRSISGVLVGSITFALLALIAYFFLGVSLLFTLFIAGAGGIISERYLTEQVGRRELSNIQQESHFRVSGIFAQQGKMSRANKNLLSHIGNKETKILFSVHNHFITILDMAWKETNLPSEFNTAISQLATSSLPIQLFNCSTDSFSQEILQQGYSLYEKHKQKKARSSSVQLAQEPVLTSSSSHQRLTYILSLDQLERGILITKGPSLGFFLFDKYRDEIMSNLKIVDGVFYEGFVRDKGKKGAKPLSDNSYELKFFDKKHTRIVYNESEQHEDILDSKSNHHSAPVWNPVQYGHH